MPFLLYPLAVPLAAFICYFFNLPIYLLLTILLFCFSHRFIRLTLVQILLFFSSLYFVLNSISQPALALYSSFPLFFSLFSSRNYLFPGDSNFSVSRSLNRFTYYLLLITSSYLIVYSSLALFWSSAGSYSQEGDFLLLGIDSQIWSTKYLLMSSSLLLISGLRSIIGNKLIYIYLFACSLFFLHGFSRGPLVAFTLTFLLLMRLIFLLPAIPYFLG